MSRCLAIALFALAPFAHADDGLPAPDYRSLPTDPPWLGRVVQFHGHLGPAVVAGARMGMAAVEAVGAKGYFDVEVTCRGPFTRPPQACFLDGVQVATGATMGKRTLVWEPAFDIVVRVKNVRNGKTAEVRPTPALAELLGASQSPPQGTHGPSAQDHERLEATSRKIAVMPVKELMSITASGVPSLQVPENVERGMMLDGVKRNMRPLPGRDPWGDLPEKRSVPKK